MSRQGRLLAKIRNNPKAVTFGELERLLLWHGFELRGSKGSHRVYVRRERRIIVVWHRPHVHPDAVKEALRNIDEILEED